MERLDGERTVSAVAPRKASWFTPRRNVLLIGAGTLVLIAFIMWKNPGHKEPDKEPPPPQNGMGQHVAYDPPQPPPMPIPLPNPMPVPQPQPTPQPQALPQPLPLQQALRDTIAPQSQPQKAPAPAARMLSFATAAPIRANAQGAGGSGEGGGDPSATQVLYKGAQIVGAKAGAAMNMDLVLMPGIIRCILDTAIDSTLPGPLMCHIPKPGVISPSGVVLMEGDTRIIGSYSNEIRQGQGRLMAVSATAYTPNGVPVPLGGSFADSLGRSGLDGDVNNHYLQRFGGAVMLSLTEGALGILQASQSSGGNSYVSFSSGGGVGSLAQQVLQSTIAIPPTITKPQGSEISLWILTPIDFSAAYKLHTTETVNGRR